MGYYIDLPLREETPDQAQGLLQGCPLSIHPRKVGVDIVKRVLICGDSFCVTDPRFPNLHWSESLGKDLHIMSLAHGGASNTMIQMQIMQGLMLRPDFVLVSFTSPFRAEFDKKSSENLIDTQDPESIYNYNFSRWGTSCYEQFTEEKKIYSQYLRVASHDCEVIRCVFNMMAVLDHLRGRGLNFAYSTGGMDPDMFGPVLQHNHLPCDFGHYDNNRIMTDLWQHQDAHQDSAPWFHVSNAEIHNKYAHECRQHIFGILQQ